MMNGHYISLDDTLRPHAIPAIEIVGGEAGNIQGGLMGLIK